MPAPIVTNGIYHATVMDVGRVVIPAPLRRALGLTKGTRIALKLVGDRIELRSQNTLISEIQEIAQNHPSQRRHEQRASEELIGERRKAAARGN